jgi:hypothetical protein
VITSDARLLLYRELDNTPGLTDTGSDMLADARTGKNGRHRLVGLLRQSIFGRLAGYEDMNDADRLCHDPAMRWVVGDRAITESAASASPMGRFETKWLSRPEIPLPAAPIGVRAFAMDAPKNQTMALACPAIRGKLFTKCEPPHTAQPIPERCCLRGGGSGRSSGECRFKEKRRSFLPYQRRVRNPRSSLGEEL